MNTQVVTPVELVGHLYSTFAGGDIPAVVEMLDDNVEWVTPSTLPWSRGRYVGREQVLDYFTSFGAALEQGRVEPDELLECGNRVVSLGHERGTCRATGREFVAPFAHVLTVRDGRIAALRGYVDTAAIRTAFGAAG